MRKSNREQTYMFYNDHLTRIGVEKHIHSQCQLADSVVQRAVRMGFNRTIVTFWLLGRARTK